MKPEMIKRNVRKCASEGLILLMSPVDLDLSCRPVGYTYGFSVEIYSFFYPFAIGCVRCLNI